MLNICSWVTCQALPSDGARSAHPSSCLWGRRDVPRVLGSPERSQASEQDYLTSGHRAPTLRALAPHEADSLAHLAAGEAVQPEQRFMKTVKGSGVSLLSVAQSPRPLAGGHSGLPGR